MKIKKFDELLIDYNSRLSKISKDDISFKISVQNAAVIFFRKLNKIDKNLIDVYFKNIDKENIEKNEMHQYALNYLILLTIKHTENSDFFSRFFPEYIDKELLQRSNWLIIRWVNIFISWIFKPKPKLLNLIEARKLLNALKNIKSRVNSSENNLLFEVDSELENYNSLSFVVEKFIENKILSLVYNPIDKIHLNEVWQETFKNKIFLEVNFSDHSKAALEIDTLLKYLNTRIKLLSNEEKRKLLLAEMILLKDYVRQKQFFLFNEKINEMDKIIKGEFLYQDTFKISGIYHLIEGIKQRFKLLCETSNNENLNNQQGLTSNFRDLFYFTIDKIQFYFEQYKENLDKQTEKCFVTGTIFYNILNRLESFLYVKNSLFVHTLNQTFDNAAYFRLSLSLALLQRIGKDLKACTEVIDSKLLQDDITELSQFIDDAVSPLQIALDRVAESSSIQNESGETAEIYQEINIDDEDTDSEWDDDRSDISETLSQNITQPVQGIREENLPTNSGEQSDSGISDSDEEELNSNHNSLSNYPHALLFWKTPINDATTAHPESISQQILVN